MDSTANTSGLISILKVLDICMEMEADAAKGYQKLAHEAQHEGPRAVLAWLYGIEGSRLRKLGERRRRILNQHPELIENGDYVTRQDTGLTKMGWGRSWASRNNPLEIMRYAIDNEIRAMQFFKRKASSAQDPTLRLMFNAAVSEQRDQAEYFAVQREEIMKHQIYKGVDQFADVVA